MCAVPVPVLQKEETGVKSEKVKVESESKKNQKSLSESLLTTTTMYIGSTGIVKA